MIPTPRRSGNRVGPRATPLAVRLFLYGVLLGLVLTAVFATVNVVRDYRARYARLDAALASIEDSYLPAIAQSVFEFNTDQLGLLLDGIVLLRGVSYARIVEVLPGGEEVTASRGEPLSGEHLTRSYPLTTSFEGEERLLGRLEVHASDAEIRRIVTDRLGFLVLSSGLQISVVALLIWFVLERAVVRHLRHIASYVGANAETTGRIEPLELHRPERSDELREITDAINGAYARGRQMLEEKDTLLQELYHRTKNNMQTIGALLDMRAARSPDNEEIRSLVLDTRTRIQAMAMVHEKLYRSNDLSRVLVGEYLTDLVRSLIASYGADRVRSRITADDTAILLDTAIPLGLIVAELVANSLKHAFPDGREGSIRIDVAAAADKTIHLRYSDDGPGIPPGFDARADGGVGMRTLIALCERQLAGAVSFAADGGFACEITFADDRYAERV